MYHMSEAAIHTDKFQSDQSQDQAFVVKSEERKVSRVMNQLISGNSYLNYMIPKIDNTKSELCDTCKVKETINHYIYDCDTYDEDRQMLEKDIERILAAYMVCNTSLTST